MKSLKSYFYALLVLTVISFSYVRTQQMDIYREIARSQQQIMTVYKYLLTEYIHELDVTELTTRIIESMLSNFDPYFSLTVDDYNLKHCNKCIIE